VEADVSEMRNNPTVDGVSDGVLPRLNKCSFTQSNFPKKFSSQQVLSSFDPLPLSLSMRDIMKRHLLRLHADVSNLPVAGCLSESGLPGVDSVTDLRESSASVKLAPWALLGLRHKQAKQIASEDHSKQTLLAPQRNFRASDPEVSTQAKPSPNSPTHANHSKQTLLAPQRSFRASDPEVSTHSKPSPNSPTHAQLSKSLIDLKSLLTRDSGSQAAARSPPSRVLPRILPVEAVKRVNVEAVFGPSRLNTMSIATTLAQHNKRETHSSLGDPIAISSDTVTDEYKAGMNMSDLEIESMIDTHKASHEYFDAENVMFLGHDVRGGALRRRLGNKLSP
jgi:hypothetical protein